MQLVKSNTFRSFMIRSEDRLDNIFMYSRIAV